MKTCTVNKHGIAQIREFLNATHKKAVATPDYFTESMLNAWAAEAEQSFDRDEHAMIEVKSYDAVSGHTETLDISDEGLNISEVEME